MLTLIETEGGNNAAQRALAESLRRLAQGPHRITLTHPQGKSLGDAWYFEDQQVWICLHRETEHPRFWNPCGLGFPSPDENHNIEVEVNPPFKGRNGRVQGAYARHDDGEVVLVHRGRVGGNFVGASRDDFWGHAGLAPTEMKHGGGVSPVVIVGRVSGVDLGVDLGRYVRSAAAFKDHLRERRKSGVP